MCAHVSQGEAEGEGERESEVDSGAEHRAWHRAQSHPHEIMTWAETKSQTLNQLSHPDAPKYFFLAHSLILPNHSPLVISLKYNVKRKKGKLLNKREANKPQRLTDKHVHGWTHKTVSSVPGTLTPTSAFLNVQRIAIYYSWVNSGEIMEEANRKEKNKRDPYFVENIPFHFKKYTEIS